jgi:hypothetical protein
VARVTVYVPDELLERAKALPGSENTSQLMQKGLRRLVDDDRPSDEPAYALRPNEYDERIIELRDRLLDEAEAEYATGYGAAVEVAEALDLQRLNQLARLEFDVATWLRRYAKAAHDDLLEHSSEERSPDELLAMPPEELARLLAAGMPQPTSEESEYWWVWRVARVLGTLANPMDFDEAMFDPTAARVRGFTAGLRDIWDAVEEPGSSRIDDAIERERLMRLPPQQRVEEMRRKQARREAWLTPQQLAEKRRRDDARRGMWTRWMNGAGGDLAHDEREEDPSD